MNSPPWMLLLSTFLLQVDLGFGRGHGPVKCTAGSDNNDGSDYHVMPFSSVSQTAASGKNCRISKQCRNGEICLKNNTCGREYCQSLDDCLAASYLPVRCSSMGQGLPSLCVQTECHDNNDCLNANLEATYGCFLDGQCKPSYGACSDSCECVEKHGMVQGEAYCHKGQCYCRTDYIDKCFTGNPPPVPTTPKAPTIITTLPPAPVIYKNQECKPQGNIYSKKGEACSVHTACVGWGSFVCLKPKGQAQGICSDLKCSTDTDCTSKSELPLQCFGGWCRKSFCSRHEDCPEGYGCFHDGLCRKVLGPCEYHCDCGNCPGIQCYRLKCFCDNQQDQCDSIVGKNPRTAPGLGHSNKHCKPKKCPQSWVKSASGCHKLFDEKQLTHEEAVQKCEHEGGYLAEIQNVGENARLSKLANGKKVWLGGKRGTEGKREMEWMHLGKMDYYMSYVYSPYAGGDCLAYQDGKWENVNCDERLAALCEITPLNQGHGKGTMTAHNWKSK